MTNDQFFYWLQGYFELSDSSAPLTPSQGACIHNHIDLVAAWQNGAEHGRPRGIVAPRIIEIRAMLRLLSASPDTVTAEIKALVAEQFQHVIDPKAGDAETQAKFNATHGGNGRPRC